MKTDLFFHSLIWQDAALQAIRHALFRPGSSPLSNFDLQRNLYTHNTNCAKFENVACLGTAFWFFVAGQRTISPMGLDLTNNALLLLSAKEEEC
jgi:hypothetical protein